jgi:hypothetical protein
VSEPPTEAAIETARAKGKKVRMDLEKIIQKRKTEKRKNEKPEARFE